MGYGHSTPMVTMPFSFRCSGCGVVITITVDVGKDYIFEDTCQESLKYMEDCCAWAVYGDHRHDPMCARCKPSPSDLDGASDVE